MPCGVTRRLFLRAAVAAGALVPAGGLSGCGDGASEAAPGQGGIGGEPAPGPVTDRPVPEGALASARSGDWHDAGTWRGGRVPGEGATAAVRSGHTVTIRQPVTVGPDLAGGTAILVQQGATLRVEADLTLRGDLEYERGAVVRVAAPAGGGLRLLLDAAGGSEHAIRPLGRGTGTPWLRVTGAPGGRVTIAAAGRGGTGRLDAGKVESACELVNVTLEDLGAAKTDGVTADTRGDGSPLVWRGVRARRCGRLSVRCGAGGRVDIDGLDLRLPRGSTFLQVEAQADRTGNGVRQVQGVTAHATSRRHLNLYGRDLEVRRLVAFNTQVNANADRRNRFERLFFLSETTGTHLAFAPNGRTTVRDSAFVTRQENPHTLQEVGRDAGVGGNLVEGCVFDGDGNTEGDAGDCILPRGEVTLRRNLYVNKAGTIASTIFETGSVSAIRNTAHDAYALALGETKGTPDQGRLFRSNLVVRQDFAVRQRSAFVPQARFEYDYNVTFALTSDEGKRIGGRGLEKGKRTWWASGPDYGAPGRGAHDRVADPGFRDPARTARGFDRANGGQGSLATLAAEAVTLNGWDAEGNEAAFDDRYAVDRFLAYMREGFTPTNPALRGAGAPGDGDVGAVDL
jgi:hypothetical protein